MVLQHRCNGRNVGEMVLPQRRNDRNVGEMAIHQPLVMHTVC